MEYAPTDAQPTPRLWSQPTALALLVCALTLILGPMLAGRAMMMPDSSPAQPMRLAPAGYAMVARSDQPQQSCADALLQCMNMMGGQCPLAQSYCLVVHAAGAVPQLVHAPLVLFVGEWFARWPAVPTQPPRS